jgi:IS4 transposase
MHSNSVFREIIKALPRYKFERMQSAICPDEKTRGFSHWSQLNAMIYCQIGGYESLRKLTLSLGEQYSNHYHVGLGEVKRSTLSYANNNRDVKLFGGVLQYLINVAGSQNKSCNEVLRLLDSSPIHLDADIFGDFSKSNGRCQGAKLHLEYDANGQYPVFFEITPANVNDIDIVKSLELIAGATYIFDRGYMKFTWWNELDEAGCRFVSRMQKSVRYEIIEENQALGANIISDKIIKLNGDKGKKGFPKQLRLIRIKLDSNKDKEIEIVSNDLESPAKTIADLYKRRWEIELLFKWIKQNLKIKKFIGESENAVKIQIITALITFVLIGLYKKRSDYNGTLSQLLVVIKTDPFRKLNHRSIFERQRSYRKSNDNQMLLQGF